MIVDEIMQANCLDWLPTLKPSESNVVISDPDWSQREFDWRLFLKLCKEKTCDGTTVLMWGASPVLLSNIISFAAQESYSIRHIFVWYKPNGSQPTGYGISRRYEVVVWMDGRPGRRGELKYLSDVWTIPRITRASREDLGHRWQKPKDLCELLVRGFSKPGDTVLDPFCGVGTILSEAFARGRVVLGCDIDLKCASFAQNFIKATPIPREGDLF